MELRDKLCLGWGSSHMKLFYLTVFQKPQFSIPKNGPLGAQHSTVGGPS